MTGFLLRMALTALGLWLAAAILSGVEFRDTTSLIAATLVLGIVNAFVRPVVILLTLPFTLVTLGLFLLVVNAAMLGLVAWLVGGFHLAGFWSAVFCSIIVSITGMFASNYVGPRGQIEVLVVDRDLR